jgi:hypothetical protein
VTSSSMPFGSSPSVYPEGDIDPGLAPFIRAAIADLSERLGVDRATISTVSGVLVVWPSSALGCPRSGMQYAQVAQDGAVIELRADGLVYRYHSGGDLGPFLCTAPLQPMPTRLGHD